MRRNAGKIFLDYLKYTRSVFKQVSVLELSKVVILWIALAEIRNIKYNFYISNFLHSSYG